MYEKTKKKLLFKSVANIYIYIKCYSALRKKNLKIKNEGQNKTLRIEN